MRRCLTPTVLTLALIILGIAHEVHGGPPASTLVYAARLSQEAERGPEVTVFVNTLGSDVVWERVAEGLYRGIATSNTFPATTFCAHPTRDNSSDVTTSAPAVFTMDRSGDSAVDLYAYGTPEEGSLQHKDINGSIFVKIEVYP